jgi:hypothetical protein
MGAFLTFTISAKMHLTSRHSMIDAEAADSAADTRESITKSFAP